MKTGITVINTEQTGMNEYKDVKTTKIFDDGCTLLQIKYWIKSATKAKCADTEMSLAYVDITDIDE